jgi:hypothetical protein
MKERPILFSGEMVRAILDGSKTQTRRNANDRIAKIDGRSGPWFTRHRNCRHKWSSGLWASSCPKGFIGDRLWVKETFCEIPLKSGKMGFAYRADDHAFANIEDGYEWIGKWKPSIFMPRAASRITLEITAIRVERLQDISETDAEAEGVEFMRHIPDADETLSARTLYEILWESINGEGSWDTNPWVWVIEFKRY